MVTDFFATTVDDWDDPSGKLHAYLVPDSATRDRLCPALGRLADLPFLAPQPLDALHATVQRFGFSADELGDAGLAALERTAGEAAAALAPVTLEFAGPSVTRDSVLVPAGPNAVWEALVASVRAAAGEALGREATHYAPPWGPHLTLAYATATGDDAQITGRLARDPAVTSALGTVTFSHIHWCAVHQNRAQGTYTFDTLFATPLGS